MHLSVLATRAHAERPMQKRRRATKAESHPSPGSERTDLRSLRRCVPTTSYSTKLITRKKKTPASYFQAASRRNPSSSEERLFYFCDMRRIDSLSSEDKHRSWGWRAAIGSEDDCQHAIVTSVSWAGWVINIERKNASGDQGGSNSSRKAALPNVGVTPWKEEKAELIIIT
ncbi:hypothetical protein CDAR_192511 [Caerostris darwini]|uniref:Uncharacterized protein n=1 Tax=Caerostris darwini TaxID=1538125 RepID=A0AAV4W6S7_9ARAC|nr:hypothetical protein CDAR_192511 [Caerostris darwini]